MLPRNIDVVVCIHAAFAVSNDKSSHIGILAMVLDKGYGTMNMIHYSSSDSKPICKIVLEAEFFAFIVGYNVRYTINHTYSKFLKGSFI